MVWHDLWPTFQWPRHLSRLARRWWSGAISVWISWRTSCVLATLIYDPQLSKEICPFPRLDVIGQSLYTIFVSIIQWHTALLPPLQLQRRVECQGHGKPAVCIRCLRFHGGSYSTNVEQWCLETRERDIVWRRSSALLHWAEKQRGNIWETPGFWCIKMSESIQLYQNRVSTGLPLR